MASFAATISRRRRYPLQASVVLAALLLAPIRSAPFERPVWNVSSTPLRAEGEPTVVVNPLDRKNVIVGGNQWQPMTKSNIGNVSLGPSGFGDCAVWSTHDGGATWSGGLLSGGGLGRPLSLPHSEAPVLSEIPDEIDDPGNFFSIDQNAVFDRKGNAWYQCINSGAGARDVVVHVYHSANGGKTWDAPVVAYRESQSGIQFDRPFLAIDNSGGPRDGTLYLTFETIFYQAWLPAVYARKSTDGGKTWGPIVRVDAGVQETMWDPRQYPVMGAGGVLYVVYNTAVLVTPYYGDPQITPLGIKVARSRDGAATFDRFVVDENVQHAASPDEAFVYFTETVSAIAADRAHPGRLAVAWPDTGNPAGEARILMRYSLDSAEHWTDRIDVADDLPGQGNQHDHVALTYLPDGRLLAVWRDRRASGGGWRAPWEVFARVFEVASDGTLTKGKVVTVTIAPQTPTTDHHGTMPTEYLGVTAGPEGVSFAWDEMRGDFPDVVYRLLRLEAFSSGGGT
jgi:hypothetical protein